MNANIRAGILFAILAATISGFSIFYNKLVIVRGIDPLIFNILKNGGVALLLTSFLLIRKKVHLLVQLSKTQWMKLFAIGIIGGSIPFVLYFEALKQVSAVNANILHKTLFLWVAMMAIPVLGERLGRFQLLGYAMVAWSNVFIGGFTGFTWSGPELMIILATIFWSVENIIAKIALKDIDSSIVAWGRMFIGSFLLLSLAVFQGKSELLSQITVTQLIATFGSILFLTFYVSCWYKALSLAPATTVTATLILSTPITNVLSAIFITHTFPTQNMINFFGTVIGVFLIIFFSKKFFKTDQVALS